MHPTALKVQERLAARGLLVEVSVLPDSTRTAAEAAASCGCELGQIVKSLVFVLADKPTMVLCAGDRRVTMLDGRPATAAEAREATGFAIGGIPPLGHDRALPTIVDESLRRSTGFGAPRAPRTPCSRRVSTNSSRQSRTPASHRSERSKDLKLSRPPSSARAKASNGFLGTNPLAP